jgi:hypothetical protein
VPDSTDLEPLATTVTEPDRPLARRTMLTGALVVGAGLVAASTAVAAPADQRPDHQPDQGHLDLSRSSVAVHPERISLKIDNAVSPPVPGEAVPLLISTTSLERTGLKVTSETGHATVGVSRQDTGWNRTVDVKVKADAPVTVWVTPHKVGPPSQPGDWITVSDGHDSVRVEVWIEPTGGEWTNEGPDETKLELGIVAVHAALMRGPDGPEVVMYSPPRKRKADGSFVWNEEAKGDRGSGTPRAWRPRSAGPWT